MHPEWYYSDYDRIFGRGNSYTEEIANFASMTSLKSADIQEIGAGTGNHAAILLQYPIASIELVDCDPQAITILRKRFVNNPRVSINCSNGFSMEMFHKYDMVYSMYSVALQEVETITAFKSRLVSVRKRLRPGGVFIFEAIDAVVSEKIFPAGMKSVLSVGDSIHDRVFVSSFYNKNTVTVQYEGILNGSSIKYSVHMLRVHRNLLTEMVDDVFDMTSSVFALDQYGRRLLIKGEVASTKYK
jgi:spermidine synthase